MNFIAAGIGAGLVSALLTVVVVKATALAVVLYLLSPLPILIVSLGWDHRSGLIATFVGSLAMAAFISPLSGLAFAIATGVPVWWFSYLALLGRPTEGGLMEWYPVGRLLAWVAILTALSFVAVVAVSSGGDFEALNQIAERSARQTIDYLEAWSQQNGREATPEGDLQARAEQMANFLPFVASAIYTLLSAIYLYVSGRVVLASGRLVRPWPDLPGLLIPQGAGLLALASAAAAFVLPATSFLGFLNLSLLGALAMAFALQGLAVIHDRTRGKPARPFLLMSLYLLILMAQVVLVSALSLFGLTESIFGLRRRIGQNRPKQPPTLST